MTSQALTPFASELNSLLLKEAEIEELPSGEAATKKMRKKVVDKKLALLATAPVKPVAGYNAGPAKVASAGLLGGLATGGVLTAGAYTYGRRKKREGHQLGVKEGELRAVKRKSDLALLRETTKEKTASIQKTAAMEKRAAAKRGIAAALRKNGMLKEACINLMAKEAFINELHNIATATGDWRLQHSLLYQRDLVGAHFEKQAFVQAAKGFFGGLRAMTQTAVHGAKAGKGVMGTMKGFFRGGQGVSKATGGQGMRGAYKAGRDTRLTQLGAPSKSLEGVSARALYDARSVKGLAPQVGKESVRAQNLARTKHLETGQVGGHAAEAAKGGFGASTGTMPRGLNEAQRQQWLAQAQASKATGRGQKGLTEAGKAERVTAQSAKAEADVAKRAKAQGVSVKEWKAQAAAKKQKGIDAKNPTSAAEKEFFGAQTAQADQAAAKVVNKPAGAKVEPAAAKKPAGDAAPPVEKTVVNKPPPGEPGEQLTLGLPGAPKPKVTEAGPGLLGGETFTKGTMPTWMPKGVSDKWAALTPEQRRLWAIGGAAGAGGLTAGAIVG